MKGVEKVEYVAYMKEMGKKKNIVLQSNREICMGDKV
jgi:hypothetical protein